MLCYIMADDYILFFFYLPCFFMTWVIMVLKIVLSLLVLSHIFSFCSTRFAIHSHVMSGSWLAISRYFSSSQYDSWQLSFPNPPSALCRRNFTCLFLILSIIILSVNIFFKTSLLLSCSKHGIFTKIVRKNCVVIKYLLKSFLLRLVYLQEFV